MGSLVCLALFISFRCIACGAGCSCWRHHYCEASPLCDAGNGPGGDATDAERTVKGALLTNLLFVLGIFLASGQHN